MTSEWEKVYQAAILETDWSKIEQRIQSADSAISARLHDFSVDHGGTPEEKQRIQDALSGALADLRDAGLPLPSAAGAVSVKNLKFLRVFFLCHFCTNRPKHFGIHKSSVGLMNAKADHFGTLRAI